MGIHPTRIIRSAGTPTVHSLGHPYPPHFLRQLPLAIALLTFKMQGGGGNTYMYTATANPFESVVWLPNGQRCNAVMFIQQIIFFNQKRGKLYVQYVRKTGSKIGLRAGRRLSSKVWGYWGKGALLKLKVRIQCFEFRLRIQTFEYRPTVAENFLPLDPAK